MTSAVKVYLRPLECDLGAARTTMRFRLFYEGELKSSQGDESYKRTQAIAPHKHDLRKAFHGQLKQLWATNKCLREHRVHPNAIYPAPGSQAQVASHWGGGPDDRIPMVEAIARNYERCGFRFVPLVREKLSLLCSIQVLFLRRDIPGSAVSAGDLDNRIKTLIDALRLPKSRSETGDAVPQEGEDPFFCLLEDDSLVTALSVETDTLLSPPTGNSEADNRKVNLILTIELKPYDVDMFNLSFA